MLERLVELGMLGVLDITPVTHRRCPDIVLTWTAEFGLGVMPAMALRLIEQV
tara:strand:- start:448 stop:603 length:156 start_codon:yes stop_codon:yes gene_type:complete